MTSLMSRLRRAGLAALLAAASVQAAGADVSSDTPSATVMSLQQGLVELSQRRAKWVREYLVGKGIASERLDSAGFGIERPIDTNDTPAGRANNRRVEFVVE